MSNVRSIRVDCSIGGAGQKGGPVEIYLDDWRDHTIYSKVELDTGARLPQRSLFYQYKTGMAVPQINGTGGLLTRRNADDRDTNFPTSKGVLPSTGEFVFYSMWLDVCALSNDDQASSAGRNDRAEAPLVSAYNLQWLQFSSIIGLIFGAGTAKPYFLAPPAYWPPEAGVLGYTSGDNPGGPQISVGTGGVTGGRMIRRTQQPIHVGARQKVIGTIWWPRGATPEAAGLNTPAMTYTQAMALVHNARGLAKFPITGGGA